MNDTRAAKSVCLACSSGGHLNQLIEIVPKLKECSSICFVTIDRPDTAQRLQNETVYFVPDLSKSNVTRLFKNFRRAYDLLKENTPDVIITNGAGAVFLYVLLARFLFRVPVILIESFARIDGLSSFGKIVSLFAHRYYVQWERLEKQRSNARYCGVIFDLPTGVRIPFPENIRSVFVILGTTEFPFPRIIEWTEKAFCNAQQNTDIVIQSGSTNLSGNFRLKHWMSHEELIGAIDAADIIITHAGSGAIVNAVKKHKYVICVPRLSRYKEHNDSHQTEIADAFTALGYIKKAYSYDELEQVLAQKETLRYPDTKIRNLVESIKTDIASVATSG